MYLYHITKIKNIESILVQGLIVNSKRNGFIKKEYLKYYYEKYGCQPIFLTNDVDFVVKTQLTEKFFSKCCVLKINVDNLTLENEYEYLLYKNNSFHNEKSIESIKEYIGKTFITKQNISSERITLNN